jgi:Family of unknown function (DUF6516)
VRDLSNYFDDLIRIFGDELGAEAIWDDEILPRGHQSGGLFFSLRFSDGSAVHVELWADCRDDPILWIRYSFHYLDRDGGLRFRHDNAPHHSELPFFPHHLHLPDGLYGVLQPRPREIAERMRTYLMPSG